MTTIDLHAYSINIGALGEAMQLFFARRSFSRMLILADENSRGWCLPYLYQQGGSLLERSTVIEIASGETRKNIQTATYIWDAMAASGADRHSLLINVGGGVIGDMGGFCAATYMRGIAFVQVPTTLLAMTDASIGGKVGIDLSGFKNLVGVFADPAAVWVDAHFLKTLPESEVRSGLAESIKHSIIGDPVMWDQLQHLTLPGQLDWDKLLTSSLRVKQYIVAQDPFEKGLRKSLNFGHTIGHALESEQLYKGKPLLHGDAVALGMMAESHLAWTIGLLDRDVFHSIIALLWRWYGEQRPDSISPDKLLEWMLRDKKNKGGRIGFALPSGIGQMQIDCFPPEKAIRVSLDWLFAYSP